MASQVKLRVATKKLYIRIVDQSCLKGEVHVVKSINIEGIRIFSIVRG